MHVVLSELFFSSFFNMKHRAGNIFMRAREALMAVPASEAIIRVSGESVRRVPPGTNGERHRPVLRLKMSALRDIDIVQNAWQERTFNGMEIADEMQKITL